MSLQLNLLGNDLLKYFHTIMFSKVYYYWELQLICIPTELVPIKLIPAKFNVKFVHPFEANIPIWEQLSIQYG